jgi:aryl-alcohol dehydrogenase-like predicted oxidoreductase/enamine deaminase RidA (YjgF/YER057c/UK114 family)
MLNSNVERCELAPGFTISRILTGLWQIADMERDGVTLDPEKTSRALAPYVEAGFTTFDMADHYGSAEVIAGLYGKKFGPSTQFFTKWVPKPGPVTREDVRAAVQRSLDRMQTGSLDLLQFHAWNYADLAWLDSLFWLQEMKQDGMIRHLGLTNVDTAHLGIVAHSGIDIVSNQICFSLLDQRAGHGMTELCRKHGIKILAFGTVAGGFLTERWLGKSEPVMEDLQSWSEMKYKRFIDSAGGWVPFQELLRTLDELARRNGVSMANVACRAILEEPAVGGIIIGARPGQSEHIEDNLRLFQFSLDEKSRSEIRSALEKLSPIPGDCGDEYRKPPFLTASGDLSHHLESMPLPYEVHPGKESGSQVLGGKQWEKTGGTNKAERHGSRIRITGVTPSYGSRVIGGDDPIAQFHFAVDKIEGALQSLGSSMGDVVRFRLSLGDSKHRDAVTRACEKRFHTIPSTETVIEINLTGDAFLVEMEAEAVVG